MKKMKLQRIVAVLLAAVFLIGGGSVGIGAADIGSSTDDGIQIADIRELLNAMTYEQYVEAYFDSYKPADKAVVIDALQYMQDAKWTTAEGLRTETCDGVEGLYTPGDGIVSWITDQVPAAGRYSIEVEYYPIVNKSAAIERVFYINGNVPFKEARYLTLSKVWKNDYPAGSFKLTDKETDADGAAFVELATKNGFTATYDAATKTVSYEFPEYWTTEIATVVDERLARFFKIDIDENEIRPALQQAPEWRTYEFSDANGFYSESFEFVVEPDENGNVILSLEGVNEPMVIKSISLVPHESNISYEQYLKELGDKASANGSDFIKIEGESFYATSSQTIYAVNDRSCAINSPSDTTRNVLNTIGGEKWQTAGQWVNYAFSVGSAGMYDVGFRFRQNVLDGLSVSRALSVRTYKNVDGKLVPYDAETYKAEFQNTAGFYNGIPFSEAAQLQFGYNTDWQSSLLTDNISDPDAAYHLYFEKDVVYIIEFEVTVGSMGPTVLDVQEALDIINKSYLEILQLTGTSPDKYRDYGFMRIMPETINDLINQAKVLSRVANDLAQKAEKSSMSATLVRIADLLTRMRDEDEIAPNLSELKSYIGTLGTWISDAKTQPLQLDYITIQGAGQEPPKAVPNFWQSLVHEISSFFQSFIRNYDRMGATVENVESSTEVWLAYGRDQSQVIRNLINDQFTPNTKDYGDENGNQIIVDLKLVAGSTLLPSILAGSGPDVYIGLGEDSVINYAIRDALLPIENMPGFQEMCVDEETRQFNEAAMIVMAIEDEEGVMHYYGLPETQGFSMMFVREDVLAELNIPIPQTWDDILAAIPTLQSKNMTIGMHSDYKIFLYQMGGELFADNGMRINLDSNVALESFENMCRFFTMYGFEYQYSFANRFRTGEMPIGFAGYTGTYNHLKVFATEIEGLWGFYPMPGIAQTDKNGNPILDDNGKPVIDNRVVSACSAIVMIRGCDNEFNAWQFMKWHVGAECQVAYSNEMVAIIGPSAKHSTANLEALESMPWTTEEYKQLKIQYEALASIPNYPGSYIIGRYTKFAFLAAYNDNDDPVEELLGYVPIINEEISRKRDEYDLETLDYVGQTLAQKRLKEARIALEEIMESSSWTSAYEARWAAKIAKQVPELDPADENKLSAKSEDYAAIRALAEEFEAENSTLFETVVRCMKEAAAALEKYEDYK